MSVKLPLYSPVGDLTTILQTKYPFGLVIGYSTQKMQFVIGLDPMC
jgi:hypothetical protein